jgi:hypothetical protein
MIGSSLPKLFVSFMFLVSSGPPTISITLSFTKSATEKPSATVVSISVKNISSEPQSVAKSDAFSDFSIRLTDATDGLEVPLTNEAKELRSGTKRGFQIRSVHGFDLPPGKVYTEDLELGRYFQVQPKGKYRLRVSRDFGSPPLTVVSNVLVIKLD